VAKRELIAPRGDQRYVRRDANGRIKESDDLSHSLQDRRRKAKTKVKALARVTGAIRESQCTEKDECRR
jgi:ribosome recycling factor